MIAVKHSVNIMNAPDSIRYYLMFQADRDDNFEFSLDKPLEDNWETFTASSDHYEYLNEFRESGEESGIVGKEFSRHYESEQRAVKLQGGEWVGWTYWHGGGKHGEPEAIDWISSAYFLDVTEEQKMVTVRTFKKATR